MKLLIDTNVFIPLEPTSADDIEPATKHAMALARLASEVNAQLYLHPEQRRDIASDKDDRRKKLRALTFEKYPLLPDPPELTANIAAVLGEVAESTHDWVDHSLLAAVHADAVNLLVTDDRKLRAKANRLGLSDRVATVEEATATLRALYDEAPVPPPAVTVIAAHNLDGLDPIFTSLRADYPGFDDWLRRVKTEHRTTWVIDSTKGAVAGVCIAKTERDPFPAALGKVLKICTFKVADEWSGRRFGELLLKTIFTHAEVNGCSATYLTVFEKHAGLIALLDDFGFEVLQERTQLGELIMVKRFESAVEEHAQLDALSYNIRFGPSALKIEGIEAFLVPILPKYHTILFPEADPQGDLYAGRAACGNGIRKAYLCNSQTRSISPGSILLFYRSHDKRWVTTIAVVERTIVSKEASEIARNVGKRTVYTYKEIVRLCGQEVLAILFRQSRTLTTPIGLKELTNARFVQGAPRSIVRLPEGVCKWLRGRMGQ